MAERTASEVADAIDMFPGAPQFPPKLPDDELRVLRYLPDWDTVTEIHEGDAAAARRLEKRGLVKLRRWKDDPIQYMPTLYGGKMPASGVREATPAPQEPR